MTRYVMTKAILFLLPALPLLAQTDVDKRIQESANVLNEIMSAPDNSIPQNLLEKAHCVGIVPNLKRGGFIIGAKYGKGVLVCRSGQQWSAPENIRIEGGSVGFQ